MEKKKAGVEFEQLAKKFVTSTVAENLPPEQFLKLEIYQFKGCSELTAQILLKNFKIKKIADLVKWAQHETVDAISEVAKSLSLSDVVFQTWILLAKMAQNIKDLKRQELPVSKYVFAGLGTAGKTSLIQYYIYQTETAQALDTNPTLGADPHSIKYPEGTLALLELGGQTQLHRLYFANPERFFLSIYALVYVIDIQNAAKIKESSTYFIQIMDLIKTLEQKCHIILLFHKADPVYMTNPVFLENVLQVRKLFLPEIKRRQYSHVIRFTSVYYPRSKLERELGNVIDVGAISQFLLKAQEIEREQARQSFKDQFKRLFKLRAKETLKEGEQSASKPEIDTKEVVEMEFENNLQLLQSEAFKSLIDHKDYHKAGPIIDLFTDSWKEYRNHM